MNSVLVLQLGFSYSSFSHLDATRAVR